MIQLSLTQLKEQIVTFIAIGAIAIWPLVHLYDILVINTHPWLHLRLMYQQGYHIHPGI